MQEKLEKDNGQGKKEKTKQTWLKITHKEDVRKWVEEKRPEKGLSNPLSA